MRKQERRKKKESRTDWQPQELAAPHQQCRQLATRLNNKNNNRKSDQTNKTKQNKTKQNKTKQNKTKQNKTKQNKMVTTR